MNRPSLNDVPWRRTDYLLFFWEPQELSDRSMDYFNTIHTEQIYLGLELDNLMDTLKPLTFKVVIVNEVPAKREYVGSKGIQFPKKNSSNYLSDSS